MFLFALIATKKHKSLADNVLGTIFFLFGLNILFSFLEFYNRQNAYPYPIFIQTTPPFILLHGPLLWFYIKAQTEQNFKFKLLHLLHFVPFLSMQIDFAFLIYCLPKESKILLDSTEGFKQTNSYAFFLMLILVSPITYYVWGLLILKEYKQRIKNYFSKIDNHINLSWLQLLLISSLVMSIIINGTFFVDFFHPIASFSFLQAVSFIFVSVYVMFLGFFGHKQEVLLTKIPLEKITVEQKMEPENKINKADETFIYLLLSVMKEKKPFINSELTLSLLSAEMNVSEEYLSHILNDKLNRNFFDFVNQYRVELFKEKCAEPQNDNLTLIALAYDCGFNSKATFNRVFKKLTNLTPSEYKQSISVK